MEIALDYREHKLITLLESIHQNSCSKESKNINLCVSNLQLGDITFTMKNANENNDIDIIIERKSINDLLSSITDGRYKEQSYRLQNSRVHNHNIIYLVEGNINTHKQYYASKQNPQLQYYSALFSLYYYKGFSVFMTHNIEQTASMIYHFALKIVRSHKKYSPFFSNPFTQIKSFETSQIETQIIGEEQMDYIKEVKQSTQNEYIENDKEEVQLNNCNNGDLSYLQCIKSEKKQNITRDNIWQIMLMQVPYVSDKIAMALLKEYDNVPNLVYKLQQNPECLNDFKLIDGNGKARKISSKVVSNICNLLL